MNNINEKNTWSKKLNDLKEMHNEISKLIAGKKVAFVDIPLYHNVGDLLIYLGTEKFFNDNNINVTYRAFHKSIEYKKISQCDVILMQGGGNFGDLYKAPQKLRELLVEKYPEKTIILLPQTIHFSSDEAMNSSAEIFKKHNNFKFYVRDTNSFHIAKRFTDDVVMMPDMAHSLHPLICESEAVNINEPASRILKFIRNDGESKKCNVTLKKSSFDWDDIIDTQDEYTLKKFRRRLKNPFSSKGNLVEEWNKVARDIVFKSNNFVMCHDEVITDRLHGIIFSLLLGKRVLLIDNSYGKNTGYYNSWLRDNPYISTY